MTVIVRPFENTMLQEIMKIEQSTREVYADFPVWATWVYSNNPEINPTNIMITLSGDRITGYGHIISRPAYDDDPVEMPHTVYLDMNVSQEVQSQIEVYQALFLALEQRAEELLEKYPKRHAEWCIQHYGTVEPQLNFAIKKGFHRVESFWLLEKNLDEKDQLHGALDDFTVSEWGIESWEDQQLFLKLEKLAFPEETPTLENLNALKELPQWKTYIVTNSFDNIVGLIMMHYDPEVRKGYIDDLFTLPEYRNRGIGQVLLSKGEQYLSETGSNAVQLHVAETNLAALHLYQQANFKKIKEKIEMRMPF